ncbi:MAG: hypothetical protein JEY99_21885 [Spirochaetales bacterium]|nr:hypothetical protein [Spirochaetales bacterium]
MRTTIRMKDSLLHEAKIQAAEQSISLTAFIEDAVEHKLHPGHDAERVFTDSHPS